MSAEPIEPPNPHRPLPEIWDGDLIIWEEWEHEADYTGFICTRLDPWVREELETLFTPAPAPLVGAGVAGISRGVHPTSPWAPGHYHCPHCTKTTPNPLKTTGRTHTPKPRGHLTATRCPHCHRDVIYTHWDNTEWVMDEGDYTKENYMQPAANGESPWVVWEQKRDACMRDQQARYKLGEPPAGKES